MDVTETNLLPPLLPKLISLIVSLLPVSLHLLLPLLKTSLLMSLKLLNSSLNKKLIQLLVLMESPVTCSVTLPLPLPTVSLKSFAFPSNNKRSPHPGIKVSYVNPIPKGKDIQLCSNYRLISLLSLPSKILEKLIHSHITKFLIMNKLLSNIQFGFRPRSSTQEALPGFHTGIFI